MDKLLAVFKREFLERVRTKWFLIATLLGPVFFAAITILPAWMAIREKGSSSIADVVVIDATGTGLGGRIARALADSGGGTTPQVVTVAPNGLAAAESVATAAVVRKERRGYLVLDSATLAGTRARYAGRNASSLADVDRVREVVQRQVLAARLEREGLDVQRVTALTGTRFRMPTERITDNGRGGSGAGNAIVATIVAFLLYMMILLYGQNILRSVLEEKTTRAAEVLVASVKPDILMAGKVLGVGAVGIVQVVCWFGGAILIGGYLAPFLQKAGQAGAQVPASPTANAAFNGFGVVSPSIVVGAILFFLLGYVLYSALFAAAGAMVSSEQEAQQAALPVMLPLIASAVFIQVVLRNPDATGAKVLAWFPLTAPIIMPMRMALTTVSTVELALVVLGVVAACFAGIWVAARIYRVGLLMYGKRPNLPELARWIRQAG